MKVHIQQIPDGGKRYEGEESNAMLDLHENDIEPVGPVHYCLDVGMSEGGLFATGTVGVDVQLQCVNCLESFRYPIRIADFATQVELTGVETVDLTEPVREDILLALPPHPHCDWSGEKVCHGVHAGQFSSTESSDNDAPNVWGALDQLKIK